MIREVNFAATSQVMPHSEHLTVSANRGGADKADTDRKISIIAIDRLDFMSISPVNGNVSCKRRTPVVINTNPTRGGLTGLFHHFKVFLTLGSFGQTSVVSLTPMISAWLSF